ncbi:hypothetical protein [Paenibacillus agilis]|uniref:Uncharacterized protein n=1 Tax=Paenibacillus agilis TaxID=3020863 RepID=A0A559IKN9_9BACL|nr:hypothetical protein [Paenibacillus agilis]TVX88177.1 hypothetical protein FPZ44_19925 [Paenibacillus agilis]
MAVLLNDATKTARTPSWASKGNSTVVKGGGYVFYSDNPEAVDSIDLADAGKWLSRDTVTGAGLVYLWHHNKTGIAIKHGLTIYNPNNFAIKVTSSNNGRTNHAGNPDSSAWKDYFSGAGATSVVINPLAWGTIFQATIPAGNNFGLVARTNVTNNSTGVAASAIFYDLAWNTNSGGATAFAKNKGTEMRRGKAPTYYNTINFDTLAPTTTNGVAYRICGSTAYPGIFGTDDIPLVTDPAPTIPGQNQNVTGLLDGGYGQQMSVTMKIQNTTSTARKFRIFMGRTTGFYAFPFVNMAGTSVYHNWVGGGSYVDMIETANLAPGATETVSFFLVIPAISTTPFVVGARTI